MEDRDNTPHPCSFTPASRVEGDRSIYYFSAVKHSRFYRYRVRILFHFIFI